MADWTAREVPTSAKLVAAMEAAMEPQPAGLDATSSSALVPRRGAPPMEDLPFRLLFSVSEKRVVGEIHVIPNEEEEVDGPGTPRIPAQEMLARPLKDQVWELGYVLEPTLHGRGVMTEAVGCVVAWIKDWMRVGKVGAFYALENPASGGVLAKCGMTFVRSGRDYWPEEKGGGLCDYGYYEMGLL